MNLLAISVADRISGDFKSKIASRSLYFVLLFSVGFVFLFSPHAFSAYLHDEIARKCEIVQNSVYRSKASFNELSQASDSLSYVIRLIGRNGGGGNQSDIYCQNIRGSGSYAPSRIVDMEWLQDYGTDLTQCESQVYGSRFGLVCARIRTTNFYAPRMISDLEWRGENGSDFGTCDQQVRGARQQVFCQRIRETQYFAPARIIDGSWLATNGVLLPECLRSIGSLNLQMSLNISAPQIPLDSSTK